MPWLFARFPEYVACGAVIVAVLGYAWLTVALSGEAPTARADDGEGRPSLW